MKNMNFFLAIKKGEHINIVASFLHIEKANVIDNRLYFYAAENQAIGSIEPELLKGRLSVLARDEHTIDYCIECDAGMLK